MSITVEATYENGTLKLDRPLPFKEHERILVSIQPQRSCVDESYGMIGWTGDPDVLRKIAEDDDCSVMES